MKTLKRFSAAIAVLATLSAPAWAVDVYAWAAARIVAGESNAKYVSAVSTHTPLLVQYVGSQTSGLVAIDAGTGDLTFTQGVLGSEAATTEFECPVSGALGGVIDVSDAACNTLQEVCDVINGTGTGTTATAQTSWRCVILDGLATDTSTDALVTISATQAAVEDGLALAGDTAVTFDVATAMVPPAARKMGFYVDNRTKNLRFNPFEGFKNAIFQATETTTFGSGTSTVEIFSVNPVYSQGAYGYKLTETVNQLWSEAGGATTAAKAFDFKPMGLHSQADSKLVVRVNNSAANTASVLATYGVQYNYKP